MLECDNSHFCFLGRVFLERVGHGLIKRRGLLTRKTSAICETEITHVACRRFATRNFRPGSRNLRAGSLRYHVKSPRPRKLGRDASTAQDRRDAGMDSFVRVLRPIFEAPSYILI